MSNDSKTLEVMLKSISHEAEGISLFEFRPRIGNELPSFEAGAHIELHLPNGMLRSYSLCNSQDEHHRYVIGVNNDIGGRGGSRFVHERMRVGDVLTISHPRNNFPLVEDGPHVTFIAGGIGITPIWSMIQRLESLGNAWTLHYCTRTRKHAAFLEPLRGIGSKTQDSLNLIFNQEPGGERIDLAAVIDAAPADNHLYCCGPVSMIEAFEGAAAGRPASQVHVEYFSTKDAPNLEGGFSVQLARSGKTYRVAPGKSILDTLLDHGVDVPFSCMEGVCGTCEIKVMGGTPDHRDVVLSNAEHAANKSMMVCCSGSKSEMLVLDL